VDQTIPDPGVPEITLVTSPGCHMCEMAKDLISAIALERPLTLSVVELTSAEGEALASAHRMPFPPLMLINGVRHGHGRISEKKLRRALDQAVADPTSGESQRDRY